MANILPEIEVFTTLEQLWTLDWIKDMPLRFAEELKVLDLKGFRLGEPEFTNNFNAIIDKLEADGVVHIRLLSFWNIETWAEDDFSEENLECIAKILSIVTVEHLIFYTRTLREMYMICAQIHAMHMQRPINVYFPFVYFYPAHTIDDQSRPLQLGFCDQLTRHNVNPTMTYLGLKLRESEGAHVDTCKIMKMITVHLSGRELYNRGGDFDRDSEILKSTQGLWLEDFPHIEINLSWYFGDMFSCRDTSNGLEITTNDEWPTRYLHNWSVHKDKGDTKSVCFDSRIDRDERGMPYTTSQKVVDPHNMLNISQSLDRISPQVGPHPSVTVAILDTGVLACHTEFKDKISLMWNFVPNEANDACYDPNGHGTNCAGIVVQTAPFVRLVVCKVVSNEGQCQLKWAADAIDWLLNDENGPKNYCPVDIISMSFGDIVFDPDLKRAVSEAVARGKVVVAAASNDGRKRMTNIAFPARFGDVICVGSCNSLGQPSSFTPTGREIDFLAHGEDIQAPSSHGTVLFHNRSGTSESTPAVVGIAAMVISYAETVGGQKMRAAVSNVTVVREILRKMASMPGHHDEHMGYGNLDPWRLFKYGPDHFRQVVEEIVGPLPVVQPARRDAETQTDVSSC
ncbi:uncharacterized protein [Branchiostoma lanceolatum]|uniref:uncharacterized protein n=1 Tax=Branchiostoma lanceolatum TaxID=7740 RepID=UPI003453F717